MSKYDFKVVMHGVTYDCETDIDLNTLTEEEVEEVKSNEVVRRAGIQELYSSINSRGVDNTE